MASKQNFCFFFDLLNVDEPFLTTERNNSSVWLESNGPGTEKFEGQLYIPRDELSFSEVVVEVSCQKPSVARFWQAVTKTKEKESYLEECEKFAWDFGLFQDSYF